MFENKCYSFSCGCLLPIINYTFQMRVQPATRAKFWEIQLLSWAQTVILWDQIKLFIDYQTSGGRI